MDTLKCIKLILELVHKHKEKIIKICSLKYTSCWFWYFGNLFCTFNVSILPILLPSIWPNDLPKYVRGHCLYVNYFQETYGYFLVYTVKPVLNGISRDQNIFPLKPRFRLIKVHYI